MGVQLRSADQHRGCPGQPAAREDRPPVREETADHRARRRLRPRSASVNSSRPFFPAFGLRLALWYATLFLVSAIVIVFVTYWLTSVSLAQRDHQILQARLGEYAAAYQRGGL